MWYSFEVLSEKSRVMSYLARRRLLPEEELLLERELRHFLTQWSAHGEPLHAGFLWENPFLAVGVDEGKGRPSGCALDELTKLLTSFRKSMGVDFLERKLVCTQQGELCGAAEAVALWSEGKWDDHTLLRKMDAPTKADLNKAPFVPLKETWLSKHLPQVGRA